LRLKELRIFRLSFIIVLVFCKTLIFEFLAKKIRFFFNFFTKSNSAAKIGLAKKFHLLQLKIFLILKIYQLSDKIKISNKL